MTARAKEFMKREFNLTTLLLGIIVTMCGATVRKVYEQAEIVSGIAAKVQNLERIVYKGE